MATDGTNVSGVVPDGANVSGVVLEAESEPTAYEIPTGENHLFVSRKFMDRAMTSMTKLAAAAEQFLTMADDESGASDEDMEAAGKSLGNNILKSKEVLKFCKFTIVS